MSRQIIAALAAGALFGLGLAVSGMTDPLRILGFLDVTGAFDPSLLLVLGGAVATTALLFRFVLRAPRPRLADRFHLNSSQGVDTRLFVGSALFGIGWGLAGYCPGPALVGIGYGASEALWFVPAMLVGMAVHREWERRAQRASST